MITLGDKVRDKVSGLVGIAVQRLEFLNGCVQYGVEPKLKKGSTEIVSWNIDEEQLEKLPGKKIKVKKTVPTGGMTTKSIRR